MHAPAVVAAARAVRALEARNRLLTLGGWSIGAALALAFLIVLSLRLLAGVGWWWAVPAGLAALGAVGTFAWVWTRRWSLAHAAGEIDRSHRTEGAVRTALELTESDGEPIFVAMARSRGEAEAARVNPMRAVAPAQFQGWWTALAAALACVAAGLFVPEVSFGPSAPPAVRPAVLETAAEQVNTARSEVETVDPATLPDPQSWNRALAELDALEEELRAGTVGEDAPARTAAALEQAAEELERQTELAAREEQSLQERAAAYEPRQDGRAGELSERLAEALRRNDLLRAEEVAREIEQAASSMTEEERRALSDALEDLASTLDPPAPPRPSEPGAIPPGMEAPTEPAPADPTRPEQPSDADPTRPTDDPSQPADRPEPTPPEQPTGPQGQQNEQGQQPEQGQQSQQGQQSEQGQQSQQGQQTEQGQQSEQGPQSQPGQQSEQSQPQPGENGQPGGPTPDPSGQQPGQQPAPQPGDQPGTEPTPGGEGARPQTVPDALREQARGLREPSGQDAQPAPTPDQAPPDQPAGEQPGQQPEPGSDPESGTEPTAQPGDGSDQQQPGAGERAMPDAEPTGNQPQEGNPGSLQRAVQDLQRRQQAREENQRLAERLRERAQELIDPDSPPGSGPVGDRATAIAERPAADGPVRFEPVDASGGRADPDAGSRVVGEWFDPDRTELPASERQAAAGQMRDAARRARDAVDNQQVPRRYRDLVQRVFERVDRRAEEIGSGTVAPQGRDANP